MKKLILSLLVASSAASAFAQTDLTGGILLYGTGGYSSSRGSDRTEVGGVGLTTDRPRVRNFIVAPGIGFNVNNHISVGLNLGYVGGKTNFDASGLDVGDVEELKTREFSIGPFVRYTQMLGEHFFVFGQLNASYLNGRSENDLFQVSRSEEDRWNGFSASYFPAVGIMFSKDAALSFNIGGVGYTYRKYDLDNGGIPNVENTAKESDFAISIGQQFNLGIQKYIGCGRGNHRMKGHREMMDDTRMMDTKDEEEESDMPKRKSRRSNNDED
jgi:opacity protein-like surface antigen